jgi:hypothetical protein
MTRYFQPPPEAPAGVDAALLPPRGPFLVILLGKLPRSGSPGSHPGGTSMFGGMLPSSCHQSHPARLRLQLQPIETTNTRLGPLRDREICARVSGNEYASGAIAILGDDVDQARHDLIDAKNLVLPHRG